MGAKRHGDEAMISVRDDLERRLAMAQGAGSAHVFTRLYHEAARAAAAAADARRMTGVSLGPLDGAIVSIKDLFDVAGEPTVAASVILGNAPPAEEDAIIVRRLRRAGAVIIGKTNMSEFAYSALGLNPHFGTPGNAHDPERAPGGSSSGAGVSAAQGTSDIAIGTDTGGSVRIPAALNGIVGFKPTAGRVPTQGAFALSYTLDSIGPLARSVADCAATDAVMAGEELEPLEAMPVRGLRLGVPRGSLFADLEPMVAQGFETALGRLGAVGAAIGDHAIEDLLAEMAQATAAAPIASIEAAEVHADWLDAQASRFDPRVRARIERGRSVSAAAYIRMMRRREALVAAFDRRLAPLDVLALPTTAISAPRIDALAEDADFTRTNVMMLRNTMVANLFGLTAISLPMPGLERPAGFMLLARRGHDRRLLAIAAAVEEALG